MALTTKYFSGSYTAGVSRASGTSGSTSSVITSTLYTVPSNRTAKIKLLYANLSYALNGGVPQIISSSYSAKIAAYALLNIGGANNYSQGASGVLSFNNYSNNASTGYQWYAIDTVTGNFSFNQNAPIYVSNIQSTNFFWNGSQAAYGYGYALPAQRIIPGYTLIGSSATTSMAGSGSYAITTYSYQPQNFFLTGGQSFDVTVSAFIGTQNGLSSNSNNYASSILSVGFLVIEESANG
jgi:hypothetical protein